jgi:hypothetical protein
MNAEAKKREEGQKAFVAELDAKDPLLPYMTKDQYANRMRARMRLRSLHSGLWP